MGASAAGVCPVPTAIIDARAAVPSRWRTTVQRVSGINSSDDTARRNIMYSGQLLRYRIRVPLQQQNMFGWQDRQSFFFRAWRFPFRSKTGHQPWCTFTHVPFFIQVFLICSLGLCVVRTQVPMFIRAQKNRKAKIASVRLKSAIYSYPIFSY